MSARLSAQFLGRLLLLPSSLGPQKEISACTLVGSSGSVGGSILFYSCQFAR